MRVTPAVSAVAVTVAMAVAVEMAVAVTVAVAVAVAVVVAAAMATAMATAMVMACCKVAMVVTAAAAVTLATSSCTVEAVVVYFVKRSVRLGFLCLISKLLTHAHYNFTTCTHTVIAQLNAKIRTKILCPDTLTCGAFSQHMLTWGSAGQPVTHHQKFLRRCGAST